MDEKKEEKIFEFFDYFSLEQIEDFEHSLYLYYEINDIVQDEYELVSKEGYPFNSDIIRLSEGLITYEDFIEDNKNKELSKNEIIFSKVIEYFKENKIKDLMDYGSDNDEGLCKLSSMYKEIMDELNIKYSNIYTKDASDGKYLTTIIFENNTSVKIDTSAWNGMKVVTENVELVYEFYENLGKKVTEKEIKNNEEIDYNYT